MLTFDSDIGHYGTFKSRFFFIVIHGKKLNAIPLEVSVFGLIFLDNYLSMLFI